MFKTYRILDLVPTHDFRMRYGNEAKVREFLSKNPPRITTWSEDIIKIKLY